MPKLHIPRIGDEFVLEKDWTFLLYNYPSNLSLMTLLGDERPLVKNEAAAAVPATLRAGTKLRLFYVHYKREPTDRADAVAFSIESLPGHQLPQFPVRFTVDLADSDRMEYLPAENQADQGALAGGSDLWVLEDQTEVPVALAPCRSNGESGDATPPTARALLAIPGHLLPDTSYGQKWRQANYAA